MRVGVGLAALYEIKGTLHFSKNSPFLIEIIDLFVRKGFHNGPIN